LSEPLNLQGHGQKEKTSPTYELDVNLTPMIDVVFNLIIFFMVITDMTQQDLEYLILPKADEAEEDPGDDPERLIVNVINFDHKNNQVRIDRGEINPNLPPIMMDGRQFENLEAFRRKLRQLANPVANPLKKLGDKTIAPIGNLNGQPIWPSDKALLVRCDSLQVFGWVQVIMQYCSFVPGRERAQELAESPLIMKLEIAVAEKEDNP